MLVKTGNVCPATALPNLDAGGWGALVSLLLALGLLSLRRNTSTRFPKTGIG